MNGKDSLGEFSLDDLSDCLDCHSVSSTDDESDSSSIAIQKLRPVPLIYSDSEDEDMNNNVEDNNDTWSMNDKSTILELFEGSSGVKIVPSSFESKMRKGNLLKGASFLLTNNMVKSFIRIFKDTVLEKCKAFNNYKIMNASKHVQDLSIAEKNHSAFSSEIKKLNANFSKLVKVANENYSEGILNAVSKINVHLDKISTPKQVLSLYSNKLNLKKTGNIKVQSMAESRRKIRAGAKKIQSGRPSNEELNGKKKKKKKIRL
ncbi:uncharacterized protein LOC118202110 [Stegodyphus dumicola]|uniref:uncharacterized protein LOC118202110 n=1 Tax=Stegodyphus dumicola TaxID=202533 RepID=UPI0015AF10B0|nr:uncharacterized protein LOC118202110 [Stegodyphus dumicola]